MRIKPWGAQNHYTEVLSFHYLFLLELRWLEKVLDTSVFLWQISPAYLSCSNVSKLTVEKPKHPRWPLCSLTFFNSRYIHLASTIYDDSLRYFPFQTFKYLKVYIYLSAWIISFRSPCTAGCCLANTSAFPEGTLALGLRGPYLLLHCNVTVKIANLPRRYFDWETIYAYVRRMVVWEEGRRMFPHWTGGSWQRLQQNHGTDEVGISWYLQNFTWRPDSHRTAMSGPATAGAKAELPKTSHSPWTHLQDSQQNKTDSRNWSCWESWADPLKSRDKVFFLFHLDKTKASTSESSTSALLLQ